MTVPTIARSTSSLDDIRHNEDCHIHGFGADADPDVPTTLTHIRIQRLPHAPDTDGQWEAEGVAECGCYSRGWYWTAPTHAEIVASLDTYVEFLTINGFTFDWTSRQVRAQHRATRALLDT